MSVATYSQAVGEPDISVDIKEVEKKDCNIDNYVDIKTMDYDYNDNSPLKTIFNQIFNFQVQYYKEQSKSDFGKYLFYKFKEENAYYKYEFDIESQRFKMSSKKDKLNLILSYEKNEIRLISYNKMKMSPFENKIKDVVKLSEMTDGTTIYVVFDTVKNKWFISTNHKINGDSNYDILDTHKDIFLKECVERGYDFDKFMNYLYSNKKETHVLLFSMRHYITPIPLNTKENILKFISVYKVNNKDTKYGKTFQEYKNSKFSDEDLKENIYSIINDMCSDTISYLDTKEFISYCKKDGFGEFIPFIEYSFNKEKDLTLQIQTFFKKCIATFKGLMVYGENMIEYFENPDYNKIYYNRPNFSINNTKDGFMLQLEYLYGDKDKSKFFEDFKELVDMYKIKEQFENNRLKTYEFFEGILDWYTKVYVESTHTFKDIPIAYKYKYVDKHTKYVKGQNFSKKIVDIISKSGRKFDATNEEDKQQLYRKLILGDLLSDYYEKTKNKQFCQYGNLYNNIFNPILETVNNKTKFKDL